MKFFTGKFFVIGALFLLLIAIPATIYFLTQRQTIQTKAAATSTLSLTPEAVNTESNNNFDIDVMLDPQQNVISYVKFTLVFDATKLEALQVTPNSSSFPQTLEISKISEGLVSIALGIGSDPGNAVKAVTKVATITFKALSVTSEGPTSITFNTSQTQVLSLAPADQPGENVLASTSPSQISISEPSITATTPSPGAQITPTSTVSANLNPTCTQLSATPASSGPAPLSVTLTGQGSDSDGTITKAVFKFGDGQTQTITTGLGQATTTVSATHTYTTSNNYSATLTFTDDKNAVSSPCTLAIEVTKAVGGNSETTTTPTIAAPGSASTAIGIVGVTILLIGAGILLLAL